MCQNFKLFFTSTFSKFANVSKYDESDYCQTSEWNLVYVEFARSDDPILNQTIHNLKPFTQYALYMKTYTIATKSETKGAISNITYFTTLPDRKYKLLIIAHFDSLEMLKS